MSGSVPGLPCHIRTRTHDYKRHGTIPALNYLDGKLIQRHTHVEWISFPQADRETPKSLAIHLIVDNYSTHKHERVRFRPVITPTGSLASCTLLRSDVIRDGVVPEASNPIWPTATRRHTKGEAILAKIQRAKEALAMSSVHEPIPSRRPTLSNGNCSGTHPPRPEAGALLGTP